MDVILVQLFIVTTLVLVHLFAGKLKFLGESPRSKWLSMSGGIAVAYVFLHIFPELDEAQNKIKEGEIVPFIEHHAYLVALIGLAGFYGLERLAKTSHKQRVTKTKTIEGPTKTGISVFWLHISIFIFYNALIGYLLVHREQDLRELLFFSVAMALHFVVNDFALYQHHKDTYKHFGRWILATAIFMGWCAGLAIKISEAVIGALFAFLAGGIMLNVLKEELPEERESRFLPFAFGAGFYAFLLLLL